MPDRLRAAAFAALPLVALVLAIVMATSMATGWLYWTRAGVARWPGPMVTDALPLDELPGHDAVPLAAYLVVFALAGLLAGLAARAARLSRTTAGLSLAGGTWLWYSGVLAHVL